MSLDPLTLALLGLVAVAAGFVDSIAGGGGLLTVPALLATGMSPAAALGTNKAQSIAGAASATITYARGGAVSPSTLLPTVATTFVGAALGAALLTRLDASSVERVLPFVLLGVAAYVVLRPRLGEVATRARLRAGTYTATVAPFIGAYDGVLGPGTGSFFALSLVSLRGHDLTRATATTKVLNLTSNAAALLVFALAGSPVWAAGAVMALGQALGARLGAGSVLTRGSAIVRPLLAVVSVALSVRLLLV